jgi:predicted esterase
MEQIEMAYRAGQHKKTARLLTRFDKVPAAADLIGEQRLAKIQGLGEQYKETEEKIALARKFLVALTKRILRTDHRPIFMAAAKVIREELHQDTLARLDGFIGLAVQEARDRKNNRRPKQSPEALMALAVSGWLMGNDLAETDVKTALGLWRARQFVLEYLRSSDSGDRKKLLADFKRKPPVAVDELTQVIRFLPPPEPEPASGIKAYSGRDLKVRQAPHDDSPGKGSRYYLQLPPEYHHQRAYPVLLVLHSADGSAKEMLRRWRDLAAHHGYILAAPEWSAGSSEYQYTEEEHARVLDVLRDLRRRFQVDSDRVFLFGFEEGGNMAYDLGLAHPDQFAGVMPMGARPKWFAIHYWPNAQYLPFYVVNGGGDGDNPKKNRMQLGDWVRSHYPALYVEYKGRGPEWFEGELPILFDWMGCKKRAHPLRELGKDGGGGFFGQEFRTLREGDRRFYWLSTNDIKPTSLNDIQSWKIGRKAAQLTARIGGMNDLYVHTLGLGQVSVWFAPGMINFEKPVTIRVNGSFALNKKRITPSLETLVKDLYERGDRQQLYLARVDVKLSR